MCNKKIRSKQDLLDLYNNVVSLLDVRKNLSKDEKKFHIGVCAGTGCTALDSIKIVENIQKYIDEII